MLSKNILHKITLLGIALMVMGFAKLESKTWEKLPGTLNYVNFIRFSEYNKNTLYVGSDNNPTNFNNNNIGFQFFGEGFQISKDNGASFSEPHLFDYSIFEVAEAKINNDIFLMAAARKQDFSRILISSNGGDDWDLESNRCESSSQITKIFPQKDGENYKFYAAAVNSKNGFVYSDDYFENCTHSDNLKMNVRDITVSKVNPSIMYLAGDNLSTNKVLISKDKGETWLDCSYGLENYRILSIQASPVIEGTVFVGVDSLTSSSNYVGMGIYMSTNFGESWQNVGAKGASIYDIQFHPSNPTYWAAAGGDKGVYVSGKSGTYWENYDDGLPESYFARKVAIPDIEPTSEGIIIYASIYGDGLYKSQHITTDVKDLNSIKDEIAIFPSPANDKINLLIDNSENYNYEIFDVLSNKLLRGSISRNESIDISSLSSGTYFILLNNTSSNKVLKFVKM